MKCYSTVSKVLSSTYRKLFFTVMDGPIVTISDGQIQGVILKSAIGQTCAGFLGIPYAQPPVGPLRFRAPEPPEKWSGLRDASKNGAAGPQNPTDIYEEQGVMMGSEDCLYLNVYTNDLSARGRPVMFYIHGGGFLEGDCNVHGYDYLVQMNAVFVFVNYRLGPMGFLNVGHEAASGNQSFRDIIMALKWTQKNIGAFGGDPGNVTIYGNSSGSVSCHLLTLLPTAKGLFHKAILQSGTALFLKNLIKIEDYDFKVGFRLASLLGMDSNDPVEVVEFLGRMPIEKLVALEPKILTTAEEKRRIIIPYFPVCDAGHCEDPIIPAPLKDLLKNDALVPLMIGHTSEEGLLSFAGKFDDEALIGDIEKHFEERLRLALLLKDESRFPEILKDVRELYLKNKPVSKENFRDYIRFDSDMGHVFRNRKVVDLRNGHAAMPTYFYCFSYLGDEPTIYQYDHGPQPYKGVAHADELSYLFNMNYINRNGKEYPKEGTPDRLMIERMIRLWYNFAATGNPTPSTDKYITTVWKPTTKDHLYYLDINTELTLKDDKNNESRKIYDKISDIYLSLQ